MTGGPPAAHDARISLSLTFHNHQPVGNFGWVVADVFERAYEPMLAALERHPSIRVGLHYSGPLIEWLIAERPGFLARVRALVEGEQVEILGGGLYEPVLVALPERDRIAQLERLADVVERTFGRRPAGAWLAERVWEPDLPTSLATAGYRWTILDDAHFRAAGLPEEAMWGPYETDDQGRTVTVFATEQGLRYRIPFKDVDTVIEHLREHASSDGSRLGVMGDDGEKFGAWPSTYDHCWGADGAGGWVDRFFGALEANAGWLSTVRPGDWLAGHAPVGRVAIPTGSYAEMGVWALPPEEARAFGAALREARASGAPEARWLRGASWRNFQVRYREVNDLHKQMLRTSAKVEAMPPGEARTAAVDHLHRGQSNDAYWHGLFGGIYVPHLRAATHAELISAEDLADATLGTESAAELVDLDLDARDEIRLASDGQVVTVDLDEGAGIGGWDLRDARHALLSVLRRRPEAYHELLREVAGEVGASHTAATSIHEAVRVKEPGLAERLVYDGYERRSGLVRWLLLEATPEGWRGGGGEDLGDPAGPWELVTLEPGRLVVRRDATVAGLEVGLQRELRLGGGRQDPTLDVVLGIENRSAAVLQARVGLEWATNLLGGDRNPQAWWAIGAQRTAHDGHGSATAVESVRQGNDWLGLEVETTVAPAADAWWAPIETVSNSEAGFERVYQGSALLLSWAIRLDPGEPFTASLRLRAGHIGS